MTSGIGTTHALVPREKDSDPEVSRRAADWERRLSSRPDAVAARCRVGGVWADTRPRAGSPDQRRSISDRARAKVIADAFEGLEGRYPHLPELVTQGHLRETELRLQKEIEQIRLELEQIRGEIRETEGRLRLELEQIRGEIAAAKVGIIKWTVGWTGGLLLAQARTVRNLRPHTLQPPQKARRPVGCARAACAPRQQASRRRGSGLRPRQSVQQRSSRGKNTAPTANRSPRGSGLRPRRPLIAPRTALPQRRTH